MILKSTVSPIATSFPFAVSPPTISFLIEGVVDFAYALLVSRVQLESALTGLDVMVLSLPFAE